MLFIFDFVFTEFTSPKCDCICFQVAFSFSFFCISAPSCFFLFFFSLFSPLSCTQSHRHPDPHCWFTFDKLASAYVKLLFFGHVGKDGIKERQSCYSEYHLPRRLKISRKITLQVEGKTAEKPKMISETFWNDVKVWLLRSYCSVFRNH